jgi:hypothetical protein
LVTMKYLAVVFNRGCLNLKFKKTLQRHRQKHWMYTMYKYSGLARPGSQERRNSMEHIHFIGRQEPKKVRGGKLTCINQCSQYLYRKWRNKTEKDLIETRYCSVYTSLMPGGRTGTSTQAAPHRVRRSVFVFVRKGRKCERKPFRLEPKNCVFSVISHVSETAKI